MAEPSGTTTAGAVSLTNLTLNNRYGNLWVIANGAITLNNVNRQERLRE